MLEKKQYDKIVQLNNLPINQHCLHLLRKAKEVPSETTLNALTLLDWAHRNRLVDLNEDLEEMMYIMMRKDPQNVIDFLELENVPIKGDPEAQALELAEALHGQMLEKMDYYSPMSTYR